MKISTKGRYGLRFMLDLAVHQQGELIALHDVAARQGVSEKYLWQIVTPLKAAGLISAAPGAKGGFSLAKPPSAITALDVLRVLEGEFNLVPCRENSNDCGLTDHCAAQSFWDGLSAAIQHYLAGVTLQQLAEKQKALNKNGNISYCI